MSVPAVPSKGKLIIVAAPSGAGKTTLCKKLLEELKGRLVLSVSCTTRQPRPGEQDGVHYHFLTPTEFQSKIDAGDFAEWAHVHGNMYGTSKSVIERTLLQGKSVLLEIDVQGADSLKKNYGERCHTIFIAPPNMEELQKRLEKRATDSKSTIETRLKNARDEMNRAGDFQKLIINDVFDRAYAELKAEVLKHG